MNSQLFSSSPYLSLLCFLLVFLLKIQSSSSNPYFCPAQFECGNIKASYPFWGGPWSWSEQGCGHPDFWLHCEGDHFDLTTMMINDVKYGVLDINPTAQTLKIAILMSQSFDGVCEFPNSTSNTTFNSEVFSYSGAYENVTLRYGCSLPSIDEPRIHCTVNDVKYEGGFIQADDPKYGPGGCQPNAIVPVPKPLPEGKANWLEWKEALNNGFELKWKTGGMACKDCGQSMGNCWINHTSNIETDCYCLHTKLSFNESCPYNRPDQAPQAPPAQPPQAPPGQPPQPPPGKKKHSSSGLVIGAVVGGVSGIVLLGFLIFCSIRKRRTTAAPTSIGTSTTTTTSQSQFTKTDIERGAKSTYLGVKVFDYTELEQATDNFHPSKELGEGGFGTVYYGVLKDGRAVAVKRLHEKNIKRVEQFMNEVGMLTTLRHPNLVNLYGCTSRHSRELLLVYEYIPNGTVADHIHARNSNSGLLPWRVRFSIAIETAGALAYLHSSEVIHRDVKTNNILLDNNFQVKVADFGLSRLFPTHVTHVSTAPQGTPGYVDPEYYQCYHLTDKSDVYSFGVILIELISSLKAVDTNRHRHDVNLANMAVNKIQNHALSELVDPSLGFEKDYAVRSTVTSMAELAFRCLQQDRDVRPAMQEVLEVLKGIQNEHFGEMKAEVVDFSTDNAALLKSAPPSISPDSVGNDKWVSHSPQPNSF